MSGDTPVRVTNLVINPKWYKERYKRLGTLRIYLNGRVLYEVKNWEEIIPTRRQSTNLLEQVWGGGTTGSGGVHDGVCSLEIKKITYYERPLSFIEVRDSYLNHKTQYNIIECRYDCGDYAQAPSATPTPTVTQTPTQTNEPTPSITPSETVTPTPTPTPVYYTYLLAEFSYNNQSEACFGDTWPLTGYTLAPDLNSLDSYIMYTDTNLTIPYNGQDAYSGINNPDLLLPYVVFITSGGLMSSRLACSALP
jgi:hypothetical protein